MKTWTVYTHVSPSGGVYVGISSNIKDRWSSGGKRYCTYNSVFKNAIEKYGWDSIQHNLILEGISKTEAIYAEKYLIKWHKSHGNSYNITDGGEGTSGMKFSEERIRHAQEAKMQNRDVDYVVVDKDFNYQVFATVKEAAEYLGGIHSNISHLLKQPVGYTFKKHYVFKHKKGTSVDIEDIKKQVLKALKQRHEVFSERAKARIQKLNVASKAAMDRMSPEEKKVKYSRSKQLKGKHHSEETKKKMSLAAKGRDMGKVVASSIKKRRDSSTPIIVFKNGAVVGEYKIAADLCKELNLNSSNVSRALKRNIKIGCYTLKYRNYVV